MAENSIRLHTRGIESEGSIDTADTQMIQLMNVHWQSQALENQSNTGELAKGRKIAKTHPNVCEVKKMLKDS